MMANKEECIKLLQETIDLLDASSCWDDHANVKAQMLGIQGEKRRERYEARKGHMLIQYLQCTAIDLFDVELFPKVKPSSYSISEVTSIPQYFSVYLTKLWEIYGELHRLANEFVMKGYKTISCPLYEYVECLFCMIIETRREIKEGSLAKWEFHHVSRRQVDNTNVHDKFEEKEHKQGYKY